MLKNLVYTSNAVGVMNTDRLAQILSESVDRNIPNGITGLLIYHEGTFLQVLEGESENVNFIYSKIKSDLRHKDVIKLFDEPIEIREFPKWEMAFRAVSKKDLKDQDLFIPLEDLDFSSSLKEANSKMILKSFYELNIKENIKYGFDV